MKTKLDEFLDNPNTNLDRNFPFKTIYADESNNIRVARLTPTGANNDLKYLYFVIGGIAVPKDNGTELENIYEYINAKQIPTDAKLKYFAEGKSKFKDILKSSRINKFFTFLIDNELMIHVQIHNYLFYSLVDIIDSLFDDKDIKFDFYIMINRELKTALYDVLIYDYDALLSLLYQYKYPSIENNEIASFINDLLNLYKYNHELYFQDKDPYYPIFSILNDLIESSREKKELAFLQNNKEYVLEKDLWSLYYHHMISFLDTHKIFDEEAQIMRFFKKLDSDYEKKLNVEFSASENFIGIQLSDVICGFTAKLMNFIESNSEKSLANYVEKLTKESNQIVVLYKYFLLLDKSVDNCQFTILKTLPISVEYKLSWFKKIIKEKIEN